MNPLPDNAAPPAPVAKETVSIKIFGIGSAGLNVMDQVIGAGLPGAGFVAVSTDAKALATSTASEKLHLAPKPASQPASATDPIASPLDSPTSTPDPRPSTLSALPADLTAVAEEYISEIKSRCAGADLVFIVAGLGGNAGTAIAPGLARIAKESGALVLGFATLPFDWEGSRRRAVAEQGLEALKAAADGVVCLPSQKVFKLIDENTSMGEAFRFTSALLAGGVRGIWRLLARKGLIEVQFSDLCGLLRDRHAENVFAVAEATGEDRSKVVVEKLLTHPMLDGGQALGDCDTLLVSLIGGPDMTMVEVNRVMEQITTRCSEAQVITGAAIDETFHQRLAVTLIAALNDGERRRRPSGSAEQSDDLDAQLLDRASSSRPGSRFVPPAPDLSATQLDQLMTRQAASRPKTRRAISKMRQGQLPLEIVSKGRFDKSEPTIHKGEDLDVPTYIRRGVALN
ncbi:MAG: hypothetical protein C5B50_15355 [Verrucomicrobia bacterium]|nr:MAG: hypothetical protein C5B50_15355 [Verrucomicrobiota bacterium]